MDERPRLLAALCRADHLEERSAIPRGQRHPAAGEPQARDGARAADERRRAGAPMAKAGGAVPRALPRLGGKTQDEPVEALG